MTSVSKVITDNCRHQLVPVADAVVPAGLRAKFERKNIPSVTCTEQISKGSSGIRLLENTIEPLQKRNVKYVAVGELQHLVNGKQEQLNLSEPKIISRVGGVDKTGNSCASAALAFIGNKMGLDVLDFRGGDSLRYFANDDNQKNIVNAVGGEVKIPTFERKDDDELAREMLHAIKKGHLYYFGCAQHAAIVRITNGKYQYLELQRGEQNGWKELTKESLVDRFFIVGRSEL